LKERATPASLVEPLFINIGRKSENGNGSHALNSDIEISRKDAKARRMKEKKNMLLQKFSKHFTNSVNSPLQKFLKTTLLLCDFACLP
jgi:hypothetical protein